MTNSDLEVDDVPARDADIRGEIEPLIEELLGYYNASSPEKPISKNIDKTVMARNALDAGWELFDLLVGWAQSHMLGIEIASEDNAVSKDFQRKFFRSKYGRIHASEALGALFSHRDSTRNWPLMKRVTEWSENYENKSRKTEDEGKQSSNHTKMPEPQLAPPFAVRKAIAKILEGPNQLQWRGDVIRSLERLEFGETDELLVSDVNGLWGKAYELDALKKQVVCFVQFEVGRGKKKGETIEYVQKRIPVSAETIRHWEKELKKRLSDKEDLDCALLAGELEEELKSLPPGDIDDGSKYGFYGNITRVKRAHYHYCKSANMNFAEIIFRYDELRRSN